MKIRCIILLLLLMRVSDVSNCFAADETNIIGIAFIQEYNGANYGEAVRANQYCKFVNDNAEASLNETTPPHRFDTCLGTMDNRFPSKEACEAFKKGDLAQSLLGVSKDNRDLITGLWKQVCESPNSGYCFKTEGGSSNRFDSPCTLDRNMGFWTLEGLEGADSKWDAKYCTPCQEKGLNSGTISRY